LFFEVIKRQIVSSLSSKPENWSGKEAPPFLPFFLPFSSSSSSYDYDDY